MQELKEVSDTPHLFLPWLLVLSVWVLVLRKTTC